MSHKIPIIVDGEVVGYIDGEHNEDGRSVEGESVQAVIFGTKESAEKLLKKFIKKNVEQKPVSPEIAEKIRDTFCGTHE